MRRGAAILLALAVASFALAAVTVRNVTEWGVVARNPPVAKTLGGDCGNPAYGVRRANVSWAVESGLNVTYVEVHIPRCYRVVFDPVLSLVVGEPVAAELEATSLTGAYAQQLSLNISLSGVKQVEVRLGAITQASGPPVPVSGTAGFRLEVRVGGGAPLGAEVARLETWLRYGVSTVQVSQKIVWVFRTFAAPPRVTILYDGFETGTLEGWERTDYAYAERKLYDVNVTETCYVSARPPDPSTITDTTRPVAGEWLAWIGFRDECEPKPLRWDYLRRSVEVPALIDGVEVRFVNVTFWWRFLTWDDAEHDYIYLVLRVGGSTYYFKEEYNPKPRGARQGPFNDTGWQRNSTVFTGLAGKTVTLEFLLRTAGNEYYRSWLYIDEVHIVAYFDCVEEAVPFP